MSPEYVICVANEDDPASLERRKVYRVLPDAKAQKRQLMRVIDESGEAYLYPADLFVVVRLPQKVERIFSVVP
jgi:hypothetical protein